MAPNTDPDPSFIVSLPFLSSYLTDAPGVWSCSGRMRLVWQKHGLTVPLHVDDTEYSVRQGTPDPRQGNNPTCFDSDSVL